MVKVAKLNRHKSLTYPSLAKISSSEIWKHTYCKAYFGEKKFCRLCKCSFHLLTFCYLNPLKLFCPIISIWKSQDLVCFTIRVPDTRERSATWVRNEQNKCDASATRGTRVWHKKSLICEWEAFYSSIFELKVILLNGIDYSSTSL